ncbi:mammalian cell entry protein [Bacteroidia bacterium]|nr:mammalian cell entry protein [Bacteroidia bacterium]
MKKYFSKEVVIGLVTIISLLVLYFGFNYLKGINIFTPTNHYYVKMGNVTELQKSSPIYIDGFKVGLVNEILYNYENPGTIIVQISLEKSMKIQKGSYMELGSSLTSGAFLSLKLNKYVTDYCQVGDTIEGTSKPGLMETVSNELLPQIQQILPRIDTILYGLQVITTHPAFSESLNSISKASANLEAASRQLNLMMANDIPVIMEDFKTISSNFSTISSNVKEINFQATMDKVNKTMDNMEKLTLQLNNKESSLGLLMNDRKLYDNINNTANNASLLLEDLRLNPKKYVHFSVF